MELDPPLDSPASAPRPSFPLPLVAVALAVWGVMTFGHGIGLDLAGRFFAWAREPGSLTKEGGQAGMRLAEGGLALLFGSIAVLVVARVAFALRRASGQELLEALVPWVAWAALLFGVWKIYIVYATELVHFGQYALVGFLVARALDGGRRPATALLVTVGLAIGDELWQHYGLAGHSPYHWMDWSDIVLDALGATAGILPLTTLRRLEGGADLPDTTGTTRKVVLGAALLTLPLLLLSPVTTAKVLGHYRYYPYWGEYTNDKPTHWPGPREGVPLALGMVLVLATLLEPRRAPLSQRAVMGLAEKPGPGGLPEARGAVGGIVGRYLLQPDILRILAELRGKGHPPVELTDALELARKRGERVFAYRLGGARENLGAALRQATEAMASDWQG